MAAKLPATPPVRPTGAPLGGGSKRSPFDSRHTLVLLLVAFGLFAWQFHVQLGTSEVARLEDPARTASQFTESFFELTANMVTPELTPEVRAAAAKALGSVRDQLSEAASAADGARAVTLARDAHELGIRALVLEADGAALRRAAPSRASDGDEDDLDDPADVGRTDRRVQDLLISYAREQRNDPLLDAVLRVHLPGGPSAPDAGPDSNRTPVPRGQIEAAEELAGTTSGDLLLAGLLRADGRPQDAAAVDAARERRAKQRGERLTRFSILAVALALVGAAALVAFGFRGPASQRLGRAEFPPGDSAALGLDLFARALFGFLAVSFAVSALAEQLGAKPPLGATGPIAWGALIVFALRYVGPGWRRTVASFGLPLGKSALLRLAPFVLAVFAVQSVVFVALMLLSGLGLGGENSLNATTELWLIGTDLERLGLALEAVVWAPLFEELAFRGLLFGALRSRMTFTGAALSSSLLFAAVHPYGAPGLVGLTWLGVVFCWSYERSRSLWPAIIAHALHNGATLAFLGLMR